MKKLILIYTFLTTALIFAQDKNSKPVGIPHRTANSNIPYLYENGYKDFEIVRIPAVIRKDTIYTSELKFNTVHSALYTQKLMFDTFGIWDKELRAKEDNTSILVWKKRQLFPDSNVLYDIYARGVESQTQMYTAVMVFDVKENDALNENALERNKIIEYFAQGIQHLKSNSKFYRLYHKKVSEK